MTNSLGNKKIMANNIRRHLDSLGLNVKDFAALMNFKYTTVLDWVNAKTYPRIDKIELMANYFKVDKSDLVERYTPSTSLLQQINDTVVQLTPPNQKIVLRTSEDLLEGQKPKSDKLVSVSDKALEYDARKRIVGIVDFAASAGTGVWQDENLGMEVTFYEDDMAEDYDSIGIVMGHSMEPVLQNGDYLFVKITTDIPNGAISIWRINGENFVKKLRKNSKPYLESLNPDYDDILLTETDDIRPLGVVVDIYREK